MERSPMAAQSYCPLFLKDGFKMVPVHPSDIVFIQICDNYAHVILTNGKQMIRSTIKDIEQKLVYFNCFCRVHRSYLINLQHVKHIERGVINMGKFDIPLHMTYAPSFLEKLLIL